MLGSGRDDHSIDVDLPAYHVAHAAFGALIVIDF
jgi:hypothetical protein